ncbi:MAG TPA: methionyl-tRNA formyltransferase [Solirubrobacteraceae bacterium]
MRTVYLGTSEFAAAVLRTLARSDHRPALVVTRPDRPRGRGRRLAAPPVAEAARELEIDLLQPEQVNDEPTRARIAAAAPEAVCVCAFGALIKEPLLSDFEMLNVHPSLLPRWRGAAPIERAIMAGDERTGVSIMRLTAGLDSGPVCDQVEVAIEPEDTYGTLAHRLEALGGELLVSALDRRPACAEQDEAGVTYAEKLTSDERLLDPSAPASELARRVRALTPHIGAALLLADGTRLGVWEARPVPGDDPASGDGSASADHPAHGALSFDGPLPRWGCADGALELVTVQPPGKRPMPGADYLRGHRS